MEVAGYIIGRPHAAGEKTMPYQRFQSADSKPRYSKGQISVFGINSIYPRTPWIGAWWSAAFIWELVVNNQAHINMAIALSFLGRFDEAKAQINQSWGLLYVGSICV
jgi:hypothetical protein